MLFLLAQVAPPAPIDWLKLGSDAIAALTPLAVFLIAWGFKFAWSKVPASVLVFSTPVLGFLVNWALAYLTGLAPASPLAAAFLGLLAVALREILSTLATKGVNGPVTATPGKL